MFLAHAGHDHISEITNTSSDTTFVIALIMLAIAVIAAAIFVYDMRKNRKPKPKK
jgi:heme/copper-type cytochrome/quinol oxidase subunit 2